MAREIVASGENGHLVMSSRGETQHVTKPLMEVSDVPVINYWLRGLKDCARLQPVNKTTFVVCNEDNVDEFENWASDPRKSLGFKVGECICVVTHRRVHGKRLSNKPPGGGRSGGVFY